MARRARVQVEDVMAAAVEEQRQREHSLASLARREDRQVDDAITARDASDQRLLSLPKKLGRKAKQGKVDDLTLRVLMGPMLAWATERVRGVEPAKGKRPLSAFRWPNEIAALKSGFHDASSGSMSNAGKIGEHVRMGGTIPSSAGGVHEPELADAYEAALQDVIDSMDARDIELLRWAFVALPARKQSFKDKKITTGDCARCFPKIGKTSVPCPKKCEGRIETISEAQEPETLGSAQSYAAAIREGKALPPGAEGVDGEIPALAREACTWWALVAREAGELGKGDDDGAIRRMRERIARARRQLRERLAAVDLGEGNPTRWLVPPAKARIVDGVVCAVTAACAGVRVVDGLRRTCEVIEVTEDVASWKRCSVCKRPTKGARR